jgi:hypothetical protein
MRLDAIQAFATRESFTISECQNLAKDLDAFDKMTFDLVGPKGRKACRWVDAFFGIFEMDGKTFQSEQFKYVPDLRCENLTPSPRPEESEIERAERAEYERLKAKFDPQ